MCSMLVEAESPYLALCARISKKFATCCKKGNGGCNELDRHHVCPGMFWTNILDRLGNVEVLFAELEYLAEFGYVLYSDNIGPKRTKFVRVIC